MPGSARPVSSMNSIWRRSLRRAPSGRRGAAPPAPGPRCNGCTTRANSLTASSKRKSRRILRRTPVPIGDWLRARSSLRRWKNICARALKGRTCGTEERRTLPRVDAGPRPPRKSFAGSRSPGFTVPAGHCHAASGAKGRRQWRWYRQLYSVVAELSRWRRGGLSCAGGVPPQTSSRSNALSIDTTARTRSSESGNSRS